MAGDDSRISFHLKFIADDDLQSYLMAADLIVLPFLDILNSGSAILALSFNRPVLVPNAGAMSELQSFVGESWVRTYDGSLEGKILDDAISWATGTPREAIAPLGKLDWHTVAETTHRAYSKLMDRGSRDPTPAPPGSGRDTQ